jgi:hypothetical protein
VRETQISAVQLNADCGLSALDYICKVRTLRIPQAVNKHSAEISESKEKFSKSSKIQLGFVTQKVSQGILRTQKFTNQEKKATRANGHRKFKKPKKTKVFLPSGVANFVYG